MSRRSVTTILHSTFHINRSVLTPVARRARLTKLLVREGEEWGGAEWSGKSVQSERANDLIPAARPGRSKGGVGGTSAWKRDGSRESLASRGGVAARPARDLIFMILLVPVLNYCCGYCIIIKAYMGKEMLLYG